MINISDETSRTETTIDCLSAVENGGLSAEGWRIAAKQQKRSRSAGEYTYTPQREELAAKMREEPARKKYDQRMRIAETPFGLIKHVLGLRQFLLRGLDKVKTEWRWTCTAVNLDKLVRGLAGLRDQLETKAEV